MNEYTIFLIVDYVIRILVILLGTGALWIIRRYALEKWITAAVKAAQMIFEPGMGAEKKLYVLDFLNDKFFMKFLTFSLTEEQLDALIEAAVLELKKINR